MQEYNKPADLVTFTEEIINGKLHFLCSVTYCLVFYAVIMQSLKKVLPFV